MIPLWERLLVAAIGPAVAAILALHVVNRFADRSSRVREEHATRDRLVKEMIETAQTLYLAIQAFWRTARRLDVKLEDRRSSSQLKASLEDLDKAYQQSRTKTAVIEGELRHRFKESRCQEAWHCVDDLLTVRYFQLVEPDQPALDTIYQLNSRQDGEKHSGLTVEQLRDPKVLLDAYRKSLSDACDLARTARLVTYG